MCFALECNLEFIKVLFQGCYGNLRVKKQEFACLEEARQSLNGELKASRQQQAAAEKSRRESAAEELAAVKLARAQRWEFASLEEASQRLSEELGDAQRQTEAERSGREREAEEFATVKATQWERVSLEETRQSLSEELEAARRQIAAERSGRHRVSEELAAAKASQEERASLEEAQQCLHEELEAARQQIVAERSRRERVAEEVATVTASQEEFASLEELARHCLHEELEAARQQIVAQRSRMESVAEELATEKATRQELTSLEKTNRYLEEELETERCRRVNATARRVVEGSVSAAVAADDAYRRQEEESGLRSPSIVCAKAMAVLLKQCEGLFAEYARCGDPARSRHSHGPISRGSQCLSPVLRSGDHERSYGPSSPDRHLRDSEPGRSDGKFGDLPMETLMQLEILRSYVGPERDRLLRVLQSKERSLLETDMALVEDIFLRDAKAGMLQEELQRAQAVGQRADFDFGAEAAETAVLANTLVSAKAVATWEQAEASTAESKALGLAEALQEEVLRNLSNGHKEIPTSSFSMLRSEETAGRSLMTRSLKPSTAPAEFLLADHLHGDASILKNSTHDHGGQEFRVVKSPLAKEPSSQLDMMGGASFSSSPGISRHSGLKLQTRLPTSEPSAREDLFDVTQESMNLVHESVLACEHRLAKRQSSTSPQLEVEDLWKVMVDSGRCVLGFKIGGADSSASTFLGT